MSLLVATFSKLLGQPSMERLKFTTVALGTALTCEIFYKVFARFNPAMIVVAAVFYLLYVQGIFVLHKRIKSTPVYGLVSGLIGLFLLEWWLVGNSPSGNPNASQIGMLIFHTAYPLTARLFVDPSALDMQGKVKSYWWKFCLFTLLGVLIPHDFLRFAWFIYVPVLGYLGMLIVGSPYFLGRARTA